MKLQITVYLVLVLTFSEMVKFAKNVSVWLSHYPQFGIAVTGGVFLEAL
jgi:hypothetical protein